jgi:hypothetical protein
LQWYSISEFCLLALINGGNLIKYAASLNKGLKK